jgi:hypothetical protein
MVKTLIFQPTYYASLVLICLLHQCYYRQ